MEIILLPVIFVLQLVVSLFMAFLALIYNAIFRTDKNAVLADAETKLKPENPWFVFFGSLAATSVLGCLVGSLCLLYWGTGTAFWWGFGVFAALGFFASISAATGEPIPT